MPGRNEAETRRSGRVTLRVPLKIYESDSNKRFLVEEVYAVKVSLWGGLIALSIVFPTVDPCRSQTRQYAN